MQCLIYEKEWKIIFGPTSKFDFCPILSEVSYADKADDQPHCGLLEIGPGEGNHASGNNQSVGDGAFRAFKFQGVNLVGLQKKVSDKMGQ